MYSIKAVSQATGISIETLRAWERRYQVVEPRRDPNQRRSFDPADIIRLRKLREATEQGHPISKLARLSDAELADILAAGSRETHPGPGPRSLSAQIVTAAEKFRPEACDQALSMALALLPVRQVVEEVLAPALREVGERWHLGQFTTAQERIVTMSAKRQVSAVLDTYNRITNTAPVIFATLSNERHELGILMCALLTAARGIRCLYMGTELPALDLAQLAGRVQASIVVTSFALQEDLAESRGELRTLLANVSDGVAVWLGGIAATTVAAGITDTRLAVLPDFSSYERALDTIRADKA